MNTDTGVNSDL